MATGTATAAGARPGLRLLRLFVRLVAFRGHQEQA